MTPNSAKPIAVIDSGLGGLTVVKALRKALPTENILYFGDTAHLPYGNKSQTTVIRWVRQIIQYLLPLNPKHVVIACNTATALALSAMAAEFPELSISGVIDPGARAAVAAAGAARVPIIGVIATEATIKSKAYERAILRRRNLARLLLRPTPLLVPMIEEGRTSQDPLVTMALRQYLQSMILRKMDVLVLGCTHYPILKAAIARVIGPGVRLIDSAEQCAQDVARRLGRKHLLRQRRALDARNQRADAMADTLLVDHGTLRTFVTDDAEKFASLAGRFLGFEIEIPILVGDDELEAAGDDPGLSLQATG